MSCFSLRNARGGQRTDVSEPSRAAEQWLQDDVPAAARGGQAHTKGRQASDGSRFGRAEKGLRRSVPIQKLSACSPNSGRAESAAHQ